jgi:competence protein ComEC
VFNITIVIAFMVIISKRFLDRWRGALVAGVGILIYTILVGADAAVVRAAIMGGLALLAIQIGRRQSGANILLFAAMIITNATQLHNACGIFYYFTYVA